jgi:hypothetical protein
VKKRVYVRVFSGCLRCPAGFFVNLEDSQSSKTDVLNSFTALNPSAENLSTVSEGQTEGRPLEPYKTKKLRLNYYRTV